MPSAKHLPLVLIVLGAALLSAAAVRSYVSDPRDYWTETRAESRAQSGNEYHALAHQWEHAHSDAERQGLEQGLEEARARFHESDTALAEARARYALPGRLMRWGGAGCLLLGAAVYYFLRGRHD